MPWANERNPNTGPTYWASHTDPLPVRGRTIKKLLIFRRSTADACVPQNSNVKTLIPSQVDRFGDRWLWIRLGHNGGNLIRLQKPGRDPLPFFPQHQGKMCSLSQPALPGAELNHWPNKFHLITSFSSCPVRQGHKLACLEPAM